MTGTERLPTLLAVPALNLSVRCMGGFSPEGHARRFGFTDAADQIRREVRCVCTRGMCAVDLLASHLAAVVFLLPLCRSRDERLW